MGMLQIVVGWNRESERMGDVAVWMPDHRDQRGAR